MVVGGWKAGAALAEKPFLAAAILLFAALAVYAPAIGGELIWDDIYLVGLNPFFKSPIFVWESFRHWLFFDSFSTYYRPVQNWSYMVDYWIWRGSPIGYHLTNILLHGTSGVLLYGLLRKLLPGLLEGVSGPGQSHQNRPRGMAPWRDTLRRVPNPEGRGGGRESWGSVDGRAGGGVEHEASTGSAPPPPAEVGDTTECVPPGPQLHPPSFGAIALGSGRTIAWVALLVSLAWTIHPTHNAAVAYISGRADSLAAVLALSAWLAVVRLRSTRYGWRCAVLAAIAFVCALLALCSKEIALVWLAIFALHVLVFGNGIGWRRKWAELAGVALVCATYALLHGLPERRMSPEVGPPPPLADRPVLMLRALGDYTGLMLFPAKLHMERTLSDPATLRSVKAWRESLRADHLSVLGLIALLAAVWHCRSRCAARRLRLFGAGWFAAAFLPISNLFPLNAEVAEHWIYLASIGFLLFVAACGLALPERWHRWAGGAACVAIVALGVRTAVRAGDWVDAEIFCQRTMASGGASPRLLATLASIYAERGQLDAQERVLRRTFERFP